MNLEILSVSEALKVAEKAYQMAEVPVGALLLDRDGKVLAKGYNQKEVHHDASLHAEMIVMREASKTLGAWRLTDTTLVVTLEPCPMCLAAMLQFRVKRLLFGAYDIKGGAISLGLNLHRHPRLNHRIEVMGGVLDIQCGELMSQFFKERRSSKT